MSALTAYSRGKSVGDFNGAYTTTTGGISASRQIARSLHLILGYDLRNYSSGTFQNYNRLVQEARVGIGYTPGDVPLRIW
jgi:hypothetical protein